MKVTKENIQTLEIPDETKTDLLSLFDSIQGKETEITELRQKVPTDSQRIVESVDFERYKAAVAELETLKQELSKKLPDKKGESVWDFFNFFGE